ncbi:MAG: arginase [Rhodocyclaceae bacterium]|nr:arginase [Rhodocyclaceae bacterium]
MRLTDVIGVASGLGASNPGCQDGPEVLRSLGFFRDLDWPPGACAWRDIVRPPAEPGLTALERVARVAEAVHERVAESLRAGHFPLVIGGDHSLAIGTWSGVQTALGHEGRLGLVWIDAHMDSHTFETTPSRAIHGMPLACLLGQGEPRLTNIGGEGAKLLPEDVCLIGVRSFESGEADLLKRLGVRVYFMDEVRRRGLSEVFHEAWQRVMRHAAHGGISLDLDALDPEEEPGVGTPVAGGLCRAELIAALRSLRDDRRLRCLEIVEYNPHADRCFATARAVHDLCASVSGGAP